MNRILQKFVGDTTASPARSGSSNLSQSSTSWAASRSHANGYANQQQQQYYGQQQPTSTGSSNGFYQQPQQGYVATNSQGHYLDEIPLSSPLSSAKPNADALFDNAHYAPQQQSGYFGYSESQQNYQQQHAPAADSFFQSRSSSSSSMFEPPPRPSSAELFAQPPRSSSSSRGGSASHFFDSSAASVADPFASAPPSATAHSQSKGFEEQRTLTTTGSVSDLFADTPRSTTPSFDGFEQQRALSTTGSVSDLFASGPPSFNGFEPPQQQQQTSASASYGHFYEATPSRSSSGTADLFANPPPAVAQTTPSSYDGFAREQPQQETSGWESETSSAADLFASSAVSSSSSFFGNSGSDNVSPFGASSTAEAAVGAPSASPVPAPAEAEAEAATPAVESASDLFAHPPQSPANAFRSSDAFGQTCANDAPAADLFAAPAHAFDGASVGSEQHVQYDQQQQQDQYSQYDQQQYYQQDQYSQYYQQDQYDQHQQQYYQQDQYYYSNAADANQEPASTLFGSSASTGDDHADVFAAAPAEANGSSDVADLFATAPAAGASSSFSLAHVSGDGAAAESAAPHALDVSPLPAAQAAAPSPTQVHDFFSEASASASRLFGSSSSPSHGDKLSSSSTPQPPPMRAANDVGTAATAGTRPGIASPPKASLESEPSSEPPVLATVSLQKHSAMQDHDSDPAASESNNDASADESVESVTRSLQKTTLDDSVKLVAMYKHMAERLEGEKNELLQVLADQADQFYRMQEYIASLEQELEAHRSHASCAQ